MTGTVVMLSPTEFQRLPMFRSVNMADVEPVLMTCPLLRVPGGTVIISAGQVPERMYVLLRGEVSVRLDSTDGSKVATITNGGVFGEFSAIDGEAASAFVVAETPCRLLGLNRDALWEMFARSPHVANNLLGILTRRIRESNIRIRELQVRLGEIADVGDETTLEDPLGDDRSENVVLGTEHATDPPIGADPFGHNQAQPQPDTPDPQ